MSVRLNPAKEVRRLARAGGGATSMGGTVLVTTDLHALDGPEHTSPTHSTDVSLDSTGIHVIAVAGVTPDATGLDLLADATPADARDTLELGSAALAAAEDFAPAGTGGTLAYVEITTPVAITATTEATADTIVTAGATVLDGTTVIEVEFYAPGVAPGTTDISLYLYDGATSIGRVGYATGVAGGFGRRRLTPTAGSHTYSVRGAVDAGSGSVQAGAGGVGAEVPCFIQIRRAA